MKNNIIITVIEASWCKDCQRQKEILNNMELPKRVNVEYIDIDSDPEILTKYNVVLVPLLIFTKGDKTIRLEDVQQEETIKKTIKDVEESNGCK